MVFLVTAVSPTASSQSRLKYDVIKGTTDTIWRTGEERLYVSAGDSYGSGRNKHSTIADHLKSTILQYPSGLVLEFAVQTGRTNSFSIYASHKATLYMEQGAEITLSSRNDYHSRKSSLGYGSWLFAFYTLPAQAIETLEKGTIRSIRLETSMGTFDYPLKNKHAGIIAEQLAAIRAAGH
jgi:hypothetical protein